MTEKWKTAREIIAITLSILAFGLSLFSTVTANSARKRTEQIAEQESFPSIYFSRIITFSESLLDPDIDEQSKQVLETLQAEGFTTENWPKEKLVDVVPRNDPSNYATKATARRVYVSLLVEVTSGDCMTIKKLRVEGDLNGKLPFLLNKGDPAPLCAGDGRIYPLFTYVSSTEYDLRSEMTGLSLILDLDECLLTFTTKSRGLARELDCKENFHAIATLG